MGDPAVEGDGEGHAEGAEDGEREAILWFFFWRGVVGEGRAGLEEGGVAVAEGDVDPVEKCVAGEDREEGTDGWRNKGC